MFRIFHHTQDDVVFDSQAFLSMAKHFGFSTEGLGLNRKEGAAGFDNHNAHQERRGR